MATKKKYNSVRQANRAMANARTPIARVRIARRAVRDLRMETGRDFNASVRGGAVLRSSGKMS